jgi:hypothetical protein
MRSTNSEMLALRAQHTDGDSLIRDWFEAPANCLRESQGPARRLLVLKPREFASAVCGANRGECIRRAGSGDTAWVGAPASGSRISRVLPL